MIGSGGNFGFDMGALLGNMMGNANNGFGGDSGIWAIILIIALCGGFRNGGGLFGGGNSDSGEMTTAVLDASIQRGFDNQAVISKLDGITNGICNLGYDQLAQMNNISSAVTQSGNAIMQSIQSVLVALMQQGFAQSTQTQSCCCNIENLLQQANYNRQADTCAIETAIANAVQAIMQNCNNNFRQLHDDNVQAQMNAKDEKIASLQMALTRCDNRADNAAQTAQILGTLAPTPVPAYPAGAPFGFFGNWGWGWNNNNCNCNGNNFYGFG